MTKFIYNEDLAQFVSDYLQIDGASKDSNKTIAEAYIDNALDMNAKPTAAEMNAEVKCLAVEVDYYRH